MRVYDGARARAECLARVRRQRVGVGAALELVVYPGDCRDVGVYMGERASVSERVRTSVSFWRVGVADESPSLPDDGATTAYTLGAFGYTFVECARRSAASVVMRVEAEQVASDGERRFACSGVFASTFNPVRARRSGRAVLWPAGATRGCAACARGDEHGGRFDD